MTVPLFLGVDRLGLLGAEMVGFASLLEGDEVFCWFRALFLLELAADDVVEGRKRAF